MNAEKKVNIIITILLGQEPCWEDCLAQFDKTITWRTKIQIEEDICTFALANFGYAAWNKIEDPSSQRAIDLAQVLHECNTIIDGKTPREMQIIAFAIIKYKKETDMPVWKELTLCYAMLEIFNRVKVVSAATKNN